MRFWLAVLVLFGGFAAAVLWQTRWTSGLRSQRAEALAGSSFAKVEPAPAQADLVPLGPPAPSPAGRRDAGPWARVLVGRPSGADPVEPPPVPIAEAAPAPASADREPFEPDFTTTVRPGQSLSVICQQHYGSARSELVRALAAYNGLDDPDRIRVGSRIDLPPEQHLLEER